jgi:hypothetical protein
VKPVNGVAVEDIAAPLEQPTEAVPQSNEEFVDLDQDLVAEGDITHDFLMLSMRYDGVHMTRLDQQWVLTVTVKPGVVQTWRGATQRQVIDQASTDLGL